MILIRSFMVIGFAMMVGLFTSPVMAQSSDESAEPLKVGEAAADFELQGLTGKVKLSEHFGDEGKNVVVVFSRANW